MKISKILSILFISLVILFGCKDDENGDSTPPGSLSVEDITPTNGGGIISYLLPDDSDVLFVRAEYTNSLGVDVYRVSSSHNNYIEIDGLNQNTPVQDMLQLWSGIHENSISECWRPWNLQVVV